MPNVSRPEDEEAYNRMLGEVRTSDQVSPPSVSSATARESSREFPPTPKKEKPVIEDTELKLRTVVVGVLLLVIALGWAFLTWNWRGFAVGIVMGAAFTLVVFVASFVMPGKPLRNNAAFRAMFYGYGLCGWLMAMTLSPTISDRAWYTTTNPDPSVVKFGWNPFSRVTSVALEHPVSFTLWATAQDGNPVQVTVDGDKARLGMEGARRVLTEQPMPDAFIKQKLRIFAADLVAAHVESRNLKDLPATFPIRANSEQLERLADLDVQWHGILIVSQRSASDMP